MNEMLYKTYLCLLLFCMMVVSQTKVPPVSFYITLLADMLCGSHTSLGFWSEVRAMLIHPNQCLASLVKSFDCEMGVMLQSHCQLLYPV